MPTAKDKLIHQMKTQEFTGNPTYSIPPYSCRLGEWPLGDSEALEAVGLWRALGAGRVDCGVER